MSQEVPPSEILAPYSIEKLAPHLVQNKKAFVQSLTQFVPATFSGKILRIFLLTRVVCRIHSDFAKQACLELEDAEELAEQNLTALTQFDFNQPNFELVRSTLEALLQSARMRPETKGEANELLVVIRTASTKPLLEAAQTIANEIAAHSSLNQQLDEIPALRPFADLYRDVEAWLRIRPPNAELQIKALWQSADVSREGPDDFNGTIFYRFTAHSRFVALQDNQMYNKPRHLPFKPWPVPQELQTVTVNQFLVSSYSGKDYCVKSLTGQYLCWGPGFAEKEERQLIHGVNLHPDPFALWTAELKPMAQYGIGDSTEILTASHANCLNGKVLQENWLVFSRGKLKIFGALDEEYPEHRLCIYYGFNQLIPLVPPTTGPTPLPSGAHHLTVYHKRLYYLTASGELHVDSRFEESASALQLRGMPLQDIQQLTANNRYLCLQQMRKSWLCFTEDEGGVRYFDTGFSPQENETPGVLNLQGYPFLAHSTDLLGDWSELSEREHMGGAGASFQLPKGASHYVAMRAFNQAGPYLCSVLNGQVSCQWSGQPPSEKGFYPFPEFKHVTELFGDGAKLLCALQGQSAECLDMEGWRGRRRQKINETSKLNKFDQILAAPDLPTIKADTTGICKMRNSEVRCVRTNPSPRPARWEEDDYNLDAPIQTTAFSLPVGEKVLRLGNQAELCFETHQYMRCYSPDGAETLTYELNRLGGGL